MKNPWEAISLGDYESHMRLDSVRQLQALNAMMKEQLRAYPASTVMILGLAGGNGLEHVRRECFEKVYGVDVNASYLEAAAGRYPGLEGVLECLCADLREEAGRLPPADLLLADLVIEYIGCECFQEVVRSVKPLYASCAIQVDTPGGWVSDSPYQHVFDLLEEVHRPIEGPALKETMGAIRYQECGIWERKLPKGKKLVRMDFRRLSPI